MAAALVGFDFRCCCDLRLLHRRFRRDRFLLAVTVKTKMAMIPWQYTLSNKIDRLSKDVPFRELDVVDDVKNYGGKRRTTI